MGKNKKLVIRKTYYYYYYIGLLLKIYLNRKRLRIIKDLRLKLLQTGSWKLWSLERSRCGLLLTGGSWECRQWTGEKASQEFLIHVIHNRINIETFADKMGLCWKLTKASNQIEIKYTNSSHAPTHVQHKCKCTKLNIHISENQRGCNPWGDAGPL